MGIDCLQIFSGNPRGWKQRPLDIKVVEAFRREVREAGLKPVVVHAPYLINLASPDKALWLKSVGALAHQLDRAAMLGAEAVVVHPGSRLHKPLEWGLDRAAAGVRSALEQAGGPAQCWLENTAGGGGQLGATLSQLKLLLDRAPEAEVCLDTAHAWGAGYRLDGSRHVTRFLDRVESLIGLDRVGLWHLNDSVSPRGSRRDQHAHLGRGQIGLKGFQAIIAEPRMAGAALVMETPKDSAWADRRNLALVRRLVRAIEQ